MRRKSKKRSIEDSISHGDILGASYICFQTKYIYSYAFYVQGTAFITFFLNNKERLFQGATPSFIADLRALFYLMSARNYTSICHFSQQHA